MHCASRPSLTFGTASSTVRLILLTALKRIRRVFDTAGVRALRRLRPRITYANVMATLAMFIALGGGAYAVTVPRNSVGSAQLKKNAVNARAVRDRSLGAAELRSGTLPLSVAGKADDTDPPAPKPGAIKTMVLKTSSAGTVFVMGVLRDPFITCGLVAPCTAQWGVYVDGKPVPESGLELRAEAGSGDGRTNYTLYGVSARVARGQHTVELVRTVSGAGANVGEFGVQLGAIGLAG